MEYLHSEQLLCILVLMHAAEVLFEVVQTRPFFFPSDTILSKALIVFTISIILLMNRFEVPIQVVGGGKALGLARAISKRAFIAPLMSCVVFPITVSNLQLNVSRRLTSNRI